MSTTLRIAITIGRVFVRRLPTRAREWVRELAACPAHCRAVFVRRSLARRRDRRQPGALDLAPDSPIVFVCSGNIIRSPSAEVLLRRHLADLGHAATRICSAGLHAIAGRAADPRAQDVARESGLSLGGHAAQPLTPELVDGAAAIFVMDLVNDAELVSRHRAAAAKVWLLGALAPEAETGRVSIPDPYSQDAAAVRAAFDRIAAATRALAAAMATRRPARGAPARVRRP